MAVALYQRIPELSPERYDRLMLSLELDVDPPAGLLVHAASDHVGAIDVFEIWQTPQAAERFVEQTLRPALAKLGVRDPLTYRIEPLRNVYVPGFDVLDRIASTSLPATVHGRVAS